jgi:hypothetical protein
VRSNVQRSSLYSVFASSDDCRESMKHFESPRLGTIVLLQRSARIIQTAAKNDTMRDVVLCLR